jgi:hydrogenase expression/formation protein HypE
MRINMTHGSGGISTRDLIKDVFAKKLGNNILNRMEDAAVLQMDLKSSGRMAYTTDSFVVTPCFSRAVTSAGWPFAAPSTIFLSMGAIPRYLSEASLLRKGFL